MQMYHVVWEMDVEAKSYREAANKALKIHRDPESIATHFEVKKVKGEQKCMHQKTVTYKGVEADEFI